jgi:hypothetical protein
MRSGGDTHDFLPHNDINTPIPKVEVFFLLVELPPSSFVILSNVRHGVPSVRRRIPQTESSVILSVSRRIPHTESTIDRWGPSAPLRSAQDDKGKWDAQDDKGKWDAQDDKGKWDAQDDVNGWVALLPHRIKKGKQL